MSVKNKRFLTVKRSFAVLFCAAAVLGYLKEFALLFALICLHEAAHILTARCFGAEITGVTLMPLGLSAGIKNFDFMPATKKVVILLSGPLLNLLLAGLAFLLFGERALFFAGSNICIFAVNILPAMPLDGGNIFMAVFNNKIGVLPAAEALAFIGGAAAAIIMVMGIIQIILYPYNFSLLCLGFYLFLTAKDKKGAYQNCFIKILTFAEAKKSLKLLPVKQLAVMRDCPVYDVAKLFGFNCYTVLYVMSEGNAPGTLTEEQLLKYILEKGINGTVFDALYESNVEFLL